MNWPWVVALIVALVVSVLCWRFFKRQQGYINSLKRQLNGARHIIEAGWNLEEAAENALPVMGRAMVELHAKKELSLEVEDHYNKISLRVGEFIGQVDVVTSAASLMEESSRG